MGAGAAVAGRVGSARGAGKRRRSLWERACAAGMASLVAGGAGMEVERAKAAVTHMSRRALSAIRGRGRPAGSRAGCGQGRHGGEHVGGTQGKQLSRGPRASGRRRSEIWSRFRRFQAVEPVGGHTTQPAHRACVAHPTHPKTVSRSKDRGPRFTFMCTCS